MNPKMRTNGRCYDCSAAEQHLSCFTGAPSKLKNGDIVQFGTDSQVEVEVSAFIYNLIHLCVAAAAQELCHY